MARTNRQRSKRHGRPTSKRARKKRVLVVSGGDVTEPEYFDLLNKEYAGFHFASKKEDANPDALASCAAREKDMDLKESKSKDDGVSEPYAYVLVVADVDYFPLRQFEYARRLCNENGLTFVISNPCFEVWLVDHVKCCPDYACTPKLVKDVALRENVVYGRNGKHVNDEMVSGGYSAACENARSHNTDARRKARQTLAPFDRWCPWTDMMDALASMGLA